MEFLWLGFWVRSRRCAWWGTIASKQHYHDANIWSFQYIASKPFIFSYRLFCMSVECWFCVVACLGGCGHSNPHQCLRWWPQSKVMHDFFPLPFSFSFAPSIWWALIAKYVYVDQWTRLAIMWFLSFLAACCMWKLLTALDCWWIL